MIENIKARYSNGVLTLLDPLHLEEGKVVVLSIEEAAPQANGQESILEMFERLRNSVPSDTWNGLPDDLVKNKKHYLYGHPKEAE